MKLLVLVPLFALSACYATVAGTAPGPGRYRIVPAPKSAEASAVAQDAPVSETDPTPATATTTTVAPAPAPTAPPSVVPPRIGLVLPVPKGGDRASVLVGAALVLGQRGLKIKMDACGGKEWAWESWLALPLVDEPCECDVENYKAEGCFAVKWIEVSAPEPQSPGGYRSDRPLKFDPTGVPADPPLPRKKGKK